MYLRWIKLLVIGLILLVLQVAVVPLIEVRGIRPDLSLVFVLVLAARRGRFVGLGVGYGIGLVLDLLSIGPMGVQALAIGSIGFWVGIWRERSDVQISAVGWFILTLSAAAVQGFIVASFLLQGSELKLGEHFLVTILPSAIYSAVIMLIWSLAPGGQGRPLSQTISRPRPGR